MMYGLRSREQQKTNANILFVDEKVFPQTLAVINTRAVPQGIVVLTGDYKQFEFTPDVFGCIIQYPNSDGNVEDYRGFTEKAHVQKELKLYYEAQSSLLLDVEHPFLPVKLCYSFYFVCYDLSPSRI